MTLSLRHRLSLQPEFVYCLNFCGHKARAQEESKREFIPMPFPPKVTADKRFGRPEESRWRDELAPLDLVVCSACHHVKIAVQRCESAFCRGRSGESLPDIIRRRILHFFRAA
jgi:hypothetical protein